MVKRLGLAVLLLVLGLAPAAQAGTVVITFTFDTGFGDTGFGEVTATEFATDTYGATAGTLTVESGAATGTYTLYSYAGSSPLWDPFYSPSGAFIVDNRIYAPSNPALTTWGLLFVGGGGEINLWGNAADNYAFFAYNGGYYVQSQPFSDFQITSVTQIASVTVPDPGSSLLLMGMGLAGLVWKRKSVK